MILTVDIGNSQTVFGVFEGAELILHGRFSSRRDWTSDELETTLHHWLTRKLPSLAAITGAAICSVVPPLEHIVRDALTTLLPDVAIMAVGPGIRTGIPIRYENPKEVGADRIVNAVAAYESVQDALIVVDFGTAITFDCVGADGSYLGGAISPGVHISMEALFRNTAKLPKIDVEPPARAIGRTTIESLQSGLFFGFLEMTDGMIDRLERELHPKRVIATGGWSEAFGAHSRRIDEVAPWLTLDGLRILHERNQPSS
jgi:type III pantothenate kinase